MSWNTYKFGDFLHRSKIPIDIEDGKEYKRVTIKSKHQGVSVRDTEKGEKIGTKKQFVLKAGQFVLSKIDARYGAFGIAPDEVEGAIITGNFWAYNVDFSIINIEWFNQFTNSQDFYDVCERASSGITHRKYLNEDFFLNYEIELPDINEQLAIVEEFKKNKITLENQSTELTNQLDLVKQLRQAFLREAMQGKLVPQNPNEEPASVLLEKIKKEKERLVKGKKIKKQKALPP
ncbi:restriction endonuclease subunit S, partial [Echinicola sediminis]